MTLILPRKLLLLSLAIMKDVEKTTEQSEEITLVSRMITLLTKKIGYIGYFPI